MATQTWTQPAATDGFTPNLGAQVEESLRQFREGQTAEEQRAAVQDAVESLAKQIINHRDGDLLAVVVTLKELAEQIGRPEVAVLNALAIGALAFRK
jgi:hypothetical protein